MPSLSCVSYFLRIRHLQAVVSKQVVVNGHEVSVSLFQRSTVVTVPLLQLVLFSAADDEFGVVDVSARDSFGSARGQLRS